MSTFSKLCVEEKPKREKEYLCWKFSFIHRQLYKVLNEEDPPRCLLDMWHMKQNFEYKFELLELKNFKKHVLQMINASIHVLAKLAVNHDLFRSFFT